MEKLTRAVLIATPLLFVFGSAMADGYDWDDIWGDYTRRVDRSTATSGNAQGVNSAIHVIDPWPPYAHDRRIPGNGQRAVGAIERYHDPRGSGVASAQPQTAASATDNAEAGGSGDAGKGQSGSGAQ